MKVFNHKKLSAVSDYVIKFEQLCFKVKSLQMEILDGVLAYSLLNSPNLTNEQKQLVNATVNKMDYQVMKGTNERRYSLTPH